MSETITATSMFIVHSHIIQLGMFLGVWPWPSRKGFPVPVCRWLDLYSVHIWQNDRREGATAYCFFTDLDLYLRLWYTFKLEKVTINDGLPLNVARRDIIAKWKFLGPLDTSDLISMVQFAVAMQRHLIPLAPESSRAFIFIFIHQKADSGKEPTSSIKNKRKNNQTQKRTEHGAESTHSATNLRKAGENSRPIFRHPHNFVQMRTITK